jgi:hypothetical protein
MQLTMLPSLAASLPADAVVLYRVSASIAQPPLFEAGPDYEPISPAWIAALVPESAGGGAPIVYRLMWARAFGLTAAAQDQQHRAAEQARIKAELDQRELDRAAVDKAIRSLALRTIGREAMPDDMTWPELKACVRAAGVNPGVWSRIDCDRALREWGWQR